MKNVFVLSFALLNTVCSAFSQEAAKPVTYHPNATTDTSKKSLNAMAAGVIGGDSLTISYHSPSVRNRVIWGGLVPYGEVWVMGAHNATSIEVNRPFVIGGKEINPGKYAIFSIPGKKEWTVIFNTNWEQHLASDYSEKDDVVRITVKPKKNKHTERLEYFIQPSGNNTGKISVAWERLRIDFPITLRK